MRGARTFRRPLMNRHVLEVLVLALSLPLGARADRPGDRITIAARSRFFGAENVDSGAER
jgi:hypothetical protein